MNVRFMCDYRCNRCRSKNIRPHVEGELFCDDCYNIQRTGKVEHDYYQFLKKYQKPAMFMSDVWND